MQLEMEFQERSSIGKKSQCVLKCLRFLSVENTSQVIKMLEDSNAKCLGTVAHVYLVD